MNNATKSNIPSKSKRNDQLFFVIPYESTYTLDVIKKTSQIILIANAAESAVVDFFNKEIGKAITFKYQCPKIIEKNTPAVISDPIITANEA